MSEVEETVKKLNRAYYEVRDRILQITKYSCSPSEKRLIADCLSHLDQVKATYEKQIQELEDVINPPLLDIEDNKNWLN